MMRVGFSQTSWAWLWEAPAPMFFGGWRQHGLEIWAVWIPFHAEGFA